MLNTNPVIATSQQGPNQLVPNQQKPNQQASNTQNGISNTMDNNAQQY
jgi:hypothetical protein